MSVFVPTGATVAVDPLDVLLVAPNGSTSTTLYLAQGQPVVVAALPAAVVAELNTAAGLVGPDTLFTTPVAASEWPSPVYIAGAQVKRVQPSGATNLGSMVLFALSGFMVTVPAVDLTAMMALINATTTGGGGGGGASYANAIAWGPEVNPFNATAVDVTDDALAFIGDEGSETVGVVTGGLQLTLEATAPGEVSLTTTVPMVPDANIFLRGAAIGPGAIVEARGFITTGGALSMSFLAATADPFAVWVLFEYRTGAA